MKKLTVCLSLLLLVLLAGCDLVPTPIETPTSLPSNTQPPAATATQVAPSATLAQEAPEQTPTLFLKETPASMPEIVPTIVGSRKPDITTSSRSPNGEWRADLAVYSCMQIGEGDELAYDQLTMVHLTDMSAVIVDFQVQSCAGTEPRGLGPLFWSSNSRYFYYTTARMGRPNGCSYWQPPIYRIDVNSQRKRLIGAGVVSPDQNKLAAWNHGRLEVWDINGDKLATGPAVSGPEEGPIAWGPDSQSIVYLQFDSYCPLSGASYIEFLNLSNSQYTTVRYEEPTFGSVRWVDFDKVMLVDDEGKEHTFDIETWKELP